MKITFQGMFSCSCSYYILPYFYLTLKFIFYRNKIKIIIILKWGGVYIIMQTKLFWHARMTLYYAKAFSFKLCLQYFTMRAIHSYKAFNG